MLVKKLLLETTECLTPAKRAEARRRIELIPFDEAGECTKEQLSVVLDGFLDQRELLSLLFKYHEALDEVIEEDMDPKDLLISTLLPIGREDEDSDALVDYLVELDPPADQLSIVKLLIPEGASSAERLQICQLFFGEPGT